MSETEYILGSVKGRGAHGGLKKGLRGSHTKREGGANVSFLRKRSSVHAEIVNIGNEFRSEEGVRGENR